jgi:hypothetical protein
LLNARSLKNKFDDFHAEIIEQHSPTVILVTESWLCADIPDSLIDPKAGYNIFRKDRNANSGGVMIMIKKGYSCAALDHKSFDNLDIVAVRVRILNDDILFACFYRSSVHDVHLLNPLTKAIDHLLKLNLSLCLCGDFNLPGIRWESLPPRASSSFKQDKFMDLFRSRGLYQHIHENTRGLNTLDLVFTNEKHAVNNVHILPPLTDSCDHDCVFFALNVRDQQEEKRPILKWTNMDADRMRLELELVNWNIFFNDCVTCEDMWLKLKLFCHHLVDKYVPKVDAQSNRPKLSRWIRKSLAKKRAAYKRRHISAAHMNRYKQISARCKQLIAEDAFSRESKVLISPGSRKFYNYVNKKLSSRPVISGITDENDVLLRDDFQVAERFSSHYKSVFIMDNGRPIDVPVKCNVDCNDIIISRKSVYDSIRELPVGFACGPDGLPSYFYKQVAEQITIPLHYIFTKSYETGITPTEWRTATVIPVFKGKGKRAEPAAYRPISLTCVVSMIMERIMKKYMSQHLDNNNLLSPHQHGFRKNKSTETQLLECFNQFTKDVDNGGCVDVVYLDISKAFDTVCHDKLFYKLSRYGIGGKVLSWIRGFLTGRSQSVKVNRSASSAATVTSGVPQGSVLGPLLFLIYINDIEDSLNFCNFKLFADDCKLYVECSRDANFNLFRQDVVNIFKWFENNQLKVAAEKCNLLHIGRRNPNRCLSINGVDIPDADIVRDLGLLVTSDLKPSSHCELLATKAHRVGNLIFRSFKCRNRDFLVAMLRVYVLSLFNHCSVLYCPYYLQDIRLLESVQRRFTKRIPGFSHKPYFTRLQELGLQTVERHRLEIDLCHCFKIMNGIEKLSFDDFFQFSTNPTRSNGRKLFKPRCRTDTRKHFFAERVVDPWNSLPESVVTSPSIFVFKKRLRSCDLSCFLKYVV